MNYLRMDTGLTLCPSVVADIPVPGTLYKVLYLFFIPEVFLPAIVIMHHLIRIAYELGSRCDGGIAQGDHVEHILKGTGAALDGLLPKADKYKVIPKR
jgi:hypothetical protein